MENFKELLNTVRQLRHPEEGCPWDLKQTHHSLLRYLEEEAYEFIAATQENSPQDMCEELGDILLQVLLHSVIAEEKKTFSLEDVCQKLNEKLIRRHPHVFSKNGGKKLQSDEVVQQWEEIKRQEKKTAPTFSADLLKLPALQGAYKIGEKAQAISFDWQTPQEVLYKVEEEWQEVKEELPPGENYSRERLEDEIGDLMFSLVQLLRHLKLNPELSLRQANQKFISRMERMQNYAQQEEKNLQDYHPDELEALWQESKIQESREKN